VGLPSGTVTFLFTDIEGSTDLLREHGDAYADMLGQHRQVLREAFGRHGGTEVDTQGDAFFVAFSRAKDAIAAAADAQADLSVPVRMGIHTGEPLLAEDKYIGMSVHRAARIAHAAHGRQVLVSEATRALLVDDDVDLRDLGEHRLKDLSAPQRLFQLGDGEFPPPRTIDVERTNLPVQPTRLIGRERELNDVLAFLGEADVQLLTLTGPGGVGKTRLALETAAQALDRFAGGAWYVPLATIERPELVLPAIAQELGVTEVEALEGYLRDRELLLVLDNFEHLQPAAEGLARLLAASQRATALVTSRERLHLSGEQEYAVGALREPDAIALFARRARAARADFVLDGDEAAVAAICAQLDRLPLAIELAAARVKILPPRAMLGRLTERLLLLTGGARDLPERLRTLRGAIAWSNELLETEEQRVFRRLSVFAGGATFEAARTVAGAELDTLESLVDKSLLVQRPGLDEEPRFAMLGTIAEFASEELSGRGESDTTERALATWVLGLLERWRAAMRDPRRWPEVAPEVPYELPNIRAALTWARRADLALFVKLAAAAATYHNRVPLPESTEIFEEALLLAEDPRDRLQLLGGRAGRALRRGDFDAAAAANDARLAVATDLGDDFEAAWAVHDHAIALSGAGLKREAFARSADALARFERLANEWGIALATDMHAVTSLELGDAARAAEYFEREREIIERNGFPSEHMHANRAALALVNGDALEARQLAEDTLGVFERTGNSEMEAFAHEMLAAVDAATGDFQSCARHLGRADAIHESLNITTPNRAEYEQKLRAEAEARARAAIGAEQFAAAWSQGREARQLTDVRPPGPRRAAGTGSPTERVG
jgi:predicted ATPase